MSQASTKVTRRRFLGGARGAAAAAPALARHAGAQAKPTITYWNGLTGADGKVMDGLIEQFTNETGIKVDQQRITWPELYAKLQVAVPAGEGPDLCLIHLVEIPHFGSDGILDPVDEGMLSGKGFRGEDYIPSTWQGGIFQGKRYSIPLDVPQHLFYFNVKLM
jgi:multiple sugar transport system substrate-binding protein